MNPASRELGGTREDPGTRPLSHTERWVIAGVSALQGAILGWAGLVLPWTLQTPFSVGALLLAVGHAACVVLMLANHRWARTGWRLSALLSLLLLLLCSWMVVTSCAYLIGLYGQLGEGLSAALLAILGQVVLLTLPTACWALVRTRGCPPRLALRGLWAPVLVLVVSAVWSWARARPTEVAPALTGDELARLEAARGPLDPEAPRRALQKSHAVHCERSPADMLSLVISYREPDARATRSSCLQAGARDQLMDLAEGWIRKRGGAGYLKLDWITAVSHPQRAPGLLQALALRPGLDGACAGQRCLMPWQLLVRGEYLRQRPLDFLRDLRFGVSFLRLRKLLRDKKHEHALLGIQTQSVVMAPGGGLQELRRLRPTGPLLTADGLSAATRAAEEYVVAAQQESGTFRYTLQPFTGKQSNRNFNLARQSGTLLVLCELGRAGGEAGGRVKQTIVRGLELLRRYERTNAQGLGALAIAKRPKQVRLGDSTLALAAFARCRERIGERFDETIARLTRLVLAMQRSDGGFYPSYRWHARSSTPGAAVAGSEPLYAAGQAILGLVILEKLSSGQSSGDEVRSANRGAIVGLPDPQQLHAAAEQAMQHVAHEHWNHPLASFFFIEENWHCLAARAALGVHENADYERFCFDYMRFKSRLILEQDSGVEPEFVGGFGFGNVIPPHNTGAAGFAEALAAAIAVKRARGIKVEADTQLLRQVMEFLMRQQWMEATCFACQPEGLGAVSEHTHSPEVRIDFVQHAWAGMGHGKTAVRL